MAKKQEKTVKKLDKFERTVLFNARASEIGAGAVPKLDLEKEKLAMNNTSDYVKIAEREYELGLLDLELYSFE